MIIAKIKFNISEKIRLARLTLSSWNSPLIVGYYKFFYRPKKGSISEFLEEYSLSRRNTLTVIQIGANDGVIHDPIHKFILRDNWMGVLLEPQPYVFRAYLSKVYQRNNRIHTLCAAIGDRDGTQLLYKLSFCNMRWATGLASFKKENVERAFSNGIVHSKCSKYNIDIPPDSQCIASEEVLIISPQTLLSKYNITAIDLLQIDVEGYDAEVIRLFDIQKTQPRVIIFENSHLAKNEFDMCIRHLKKNNYRIKTYGANTLAMLNPSDQFRKYFEDGK